MALGAHEESPQRPEGPDAKRNFILQQGLSCNRH
jgi:hypothetical protein